MGTSLSKTFTVWRAIFLREAVSRLFSTRTSWFWVLMEPVLHCSYLVLLYTYIRVRTVQNMDVIVWLIAGTLSFTFFRRAMNQIWNGVDVNRPLFLFRQIRPVDVLLTRSFLEVYFLILGGIIIFSGTHLFHPILFPDNVILIVAGVCGLWLLSIGIGMILSVLGSLVDDVDKVFSVIMYPLGIISGVLLPISNFPTPYNEWLMYNPVAHGLELVRSGFSSLYHVDPGLSVIYLFQCAIGAVAAGLMLQIGFESRLRSK